MKTHKTVLVLGAGASYPYGFPLGQQLVRDIADSLHPNANDAVVRDIAAVTRADRAAILDFGNKLYHSDVQSIDLFLEHRKAEFVDIGRAAIARVLIQKEDQNRFYVGFSSTQKDQAWYKDFKDAWMSGPLEDVAKLQLTIVTFNYDRSLEQYLYVTLTNLHNGADAQVAEILAGFKFIHVYGSLGRLHWQKDGGERHDYETSLSNPRIESAHKGIAVMFQGDNDTRYGEAAAAIQAADKVYFMGHGYNDEVLKRLLGGMRLPADKAIGTSVGLGQVQAGRVMGDWGIGLPGYEYGRREVDIRTLLHHHAFFK